ncbi:unnamed protein product [Rotaria sp. Silwood1]|nr:unnamed protein product [Rotaria sp. Silwood1]
MVEDLTNEINNATADERKILEERLNDISIRMKTKKFSFTIFVAIEEHDGQTFESGVRLLDVLFENVIDWNGG